MKRGFTLIEVLIVIIIIGILATLLLPQITGMAERARTVEAKNTMAAIRTTIMAYYLEQNNTMPDAAGTSDLVNSTLGMVVGPETKRLFEYAYDRTNDTQTIVFSERNANAGGDGLTQHSRLKMAVYGDGSADPIVTEYQAGIADATPASGPDTGW